VSTPAAMARVKGPVARRKSLASKLIYAGPAVSHALEVVKVVAGGQIVLSQAAWEAMGTDQPAGTYVRHLGEHRLKSESCPISALMELVPTCLSNRSFPSITSLVFSSHSPGYADSPDPAQPMAIVFVSTHLASAYLGADAENETDIADAQVAGPSPRRMHVRAASVPARPHRDEEMGEPQRARGRSTYYYYDHTGAKTKAVEQASMQAAISLFCSTLREIVLRFDGYECKEPEPGKFTLAFSRLEDALLFASKLHTELLSVPWPPDVLHEPHCAEEYDALGRVVFRGLRARVGIAYGTPTMRKPLNSGRADYFGPLPNLAARVMASAAYGQTLVEPTLQLRGVAWDSTAPVLRSWDASDPDDVLLTVLGRFSLKGVPHEVTLAQVGAHARASDARTHARTHTRARTHTHT
jgi:class 3 adenylate cyclase